MTEDEKRIISDAIYMGLNGIAGVMTFVDPDGFIITNYVPFRRKFGLIPPTKEHRKFAVSVYRYIIKEQSK